jgi:adenylate kinase family enzyme
LEKSDEAKVYMDSGRNVPSNIAAPILEKLWAYIPKKLESGNIIVLDGVVRTPEQVTTAELRNIPFLRVVFEVSRKHLFIRGDKRVVCPICRFSTDKSGYCPKHPTTVLVKRSDDSEDKLQARIEEYNRDIPQILELYDSSNTPYYWLNANGSKREVQRNFKHLCLNLSKK